MRKWITAAIPVVVIAAVVALAVAGAPGEESMPSEPDGGSAATERFLSTYLDGDGRVVRHDEGDDTVSEGQAYALLLTAEAGDEARFDRVWAWTHRNLQRPDGLFAWRWQDGRITDDNPAPDADLDIVTALVAAGNRFDRQELVDEARRIADAVIRHETTTVDGRLTLVAGPWARADRVVNPSYLARCDYDDLAEVTGDDRWRQLGDDGLDQLQGLIDAGLPPDWATVGSGGRLQPIAAPDRLQAPGRYGLDAARIAPRLAACPEGQELAARLWDRLRTLDDGGSGIAYSLDGEALDTARHPLGLIGAAGAALAAGESAEARQLLSRAERLDRRQPTYYGAAWLALGDTLVDVPTDDQGAAASPSVQLVASYRPAAATRAAQPAPTTLPTTVVPNAQATTTTTVPTTTTPPATTTPTAPTTTAPPATATPSTSATATTTPGTGGSTTSTATSTTTSGTAVTTTTRAGATADASDTTSGASEGRGSTSDSTTSRTDEEHDPSTGNGGSRPATPDGSTSEAHAEAGDLSLGEPRIGPSRQRGTPEERTRRRTGAVTMAGFGGIIALGVALGLRERGQLRRQARVPAAAAPVAPSG
jgi:endoglucanase